MKNIHTLFPQYKDEIQIMVLRNSLSDYIFFLDSIIIFNMGYKNLLLINAINTKVLFESCLEHMDENGYDIVVINIITNQIEYMNSVDFEHFNYIKR